MGQKIALMMLLPALAVAYAGIQGYFLGQTAFWLEIAIPAGLVLAVVLAVVAYAVRSRFVLVSRDGVTFGRGVSDELRVDWSQIAPPKFPYGRGAIAFDLTLRDDDGSDAPCVVQLTAEQARAILTSTSCPQWALSSEVRKSLGLQDSPHFEGLKSRTAD